MALTERIAICLNMQTFVKPESKPLFQQTQDQLKSPQKKRKEGLRADTIITWPTTTTTPICESQGLTLSTASQVSFLRFATWE